MALTTANLNNIRNFLHGSNERFTGKFLIIGALPATYRQVTRSLYVRFIARLSTCRHSRYKPSSPDHSMVTPTQVSGNVVLYHRPLARCRLPSSSYHRLVYLVVDSQRLPYEVKGQMLRFFRSSFLSEYSDVSENFGLHMVQENPEVLYTYAPEQDLWVLDRLTAGHYFFPEL